LTLGPNVGGGGENELPLLRREPDIHPTSIFGLSASQAPWWVAHVRSRQEKALARYLRPLDVPFYLPQAERRVRRGNRTFVSHLPVFPGYLFFRGLAASRLVALRSNLIVKVLDVSDQELLSEELTQLRCLQESGAALIPCAPIVTGDSVRIVEGPFKGYRGIVLKSAERPRLVVSISILRKAVAVELERDAVALEPIAAASRSAVRAAVA